MTATISSRADVAVIVHRVEVWLQAGESDPMAALALEEARLLGCDIDQIRTARVYLIEADLAATDMGRIATELLADPVNQQAQLGTEPLPKRGVIVEIHHKPGVMDPEAQSTRDAIVEMLPHLDREAVTVRTGRRYDLIGAGATRQSAQQLALAALANPVIQDIHDQPYVPDRFSHGSIYELKIRHVPLVGLDDVGMAKLSRDAHLFLSLDEMSTIRDHYREVGREPTDIELETFAQTWSEHCVHKTLKSKVQYRDNGLEPFASGMSPQEMSLRPGHTVNDDGSITIDNLLKSTIVAATEQLCRDAAIGDWCVSVFSDNAGIVRFDDNDGIAVKVETHNHPSAIEPYGGAATGIGGCIRDIMGTGLAARPIANMDTFAVAPPSVTNREATALPKGIIVPQRILQQVVAGVRDYGNRMGIPTVNGSVYFDEDYLGNPLVFAGCVGLIPLEMAFGEPQSGDRIIVLGGRTGRDGIHGATFSSAELTDTHSHEFSHAVQIGNAITQKKMLDVIVQARDAEGGPLYNAITDCGAGGFSSAVGEMGQKVGAKVALSSAPLKYQGLSYTEIWISEAQERMVLAVAPDNVDNLRQLCDSEDVEFCDLGQYGVFNDQGEPLLILTYNDVEVGRISMPLLHDGIPTPTRQARWQCGVEQSKPDVPSQVDIGGMLLSLLAHPNIASKHWIVRQYDHEVQGGSVVKPLVGPHQDGPSDAAVIRPKLISDRGVAVGAGMQPGIGEKAIPALACDGDSYWMALASIDEAVRNVVCVGADPARIAILDNFCWPGCDDSKQLGSLVRASEACYDAALAYRTPFVSGKDSLNNQFTREEGQLITIPPTLLITAVGMVNDVKRCVTMDAKAVGDVLILVGQTTTAMGGSHYLRVSGDKTRDMHIPRVDLKAGPKAAAAVAGLICNGMVRAAHDCSDGGLLVAVAEMAFAGRIGIDLQLVESHEIDLASLCFSETPGRYLVEIEAAQQLAVTAQLEQAGVSHAVIGRFAEHDRLALNSMVNLSLNQLLETWHAPLDW